MFSVSCLCVMATGLLCSSMLPVVSFLYFCMFVNIYANRKKKKKGTRVSLLMVYLNQLPIVLKNLASI